VNWCHWCGCQPGCSCRRKWQGTWNVWTARPTVLSSTTALRSSVSVRFTLLITSAEWGVVLVSCVCNRGDSLTWLREQCRFSIRRQLFWDNAIEFWPKLVQNPACLGSSVMGYSTGYNAHWPCGIQAAKRSGIQIPAFRIQILCGLFIHTG